MFSILKQLALKQTDTLRERQGEGVSQASSGFSILEILIVVVIVGLLGAIAAPSWLALANRQRLNTSRDEVLQAIRTTQSTAKQKRRGQELEFTDDGTDDIPTITVGGVDVELGSGNFEPDMVNMTVTDGADTKVEKLEFLQDGSISTSATLPIKIVFTPAAGGAKRCLVVETLLGGVRAASDSDCS